MTDETLTRIYGPNACRYRDFICYLSDTAFGNWEYTHKDYDGPEDDNRFGHARTLQDCKDDIDERFYDEG